MLPDGKRCISAGNDAVLFVWNLETGELLDRLVGHRTVIMGLALSPDGRFVASVGSDRELIVWDVAGSQILSRWPHPREMLPAMAFLRNRPTLAVSRDDGFVDLVDVQSAKKRRQIEIAEVAIMSLAFTPDSEMICGCADGTIRIWPLIDADSLVP